MELPESVTQKSQYKVFEKNTNNCNMVVKVRWDDECGNGKNAFAITGAKYQPGKRRTEGALVVSGCIHDEIEEHFPELSHLIKWHLVMADGPMHYIANTLYHAREVEKYQHFVYLKDDLLKSPVLLGLFSDFDLESVENRFANFELDVKSEKTPDSKKAQPEAARRSAIWPEATLDDLRDEQKLKDRLPELMQRFKKDVEELGFVY